jgi:hypothetical protein
MIFRHNLFIKRYNDKTYPKNEGKIKKQRISCDRDDSLNYLLLNVKSYRHCSDVLFCNLFDACGEYRGEKRSGESNNE